MHYLVKHVGLSRLDSDCAKTSWPVSACICICTRSLGELLHVATPGIALACRRFHETCPRIRNTEHQFLFAGCCTIPRRSRQRNRLDVKDLETIFVSGFSLQPPLNGGTSEAGAGGGNLHCKPSHVQGPDCAKRPSSTPTRVRRALGGGADGQP